MTMAMGLPKLVATIPIVGQMTVDNYGHRASRSRCEYISFRCQCPLLYMGRTTKTNKWQTRPLVRQGAPWLL